MHKFHTMKKAIMEDSPKVNIHPQTNLRAREYVMTIEKRESKLTHYLVHNSIKKSLYITIAMLKTH